MPSRQTAEPPTAEFPFADGDPNPPELSIARRKIGMFVA